MFIKTNRGFSLIEVLVTMGLVAVLAAVAIPAYDNYRKTANESVLKSDVSNGYKAYHAYNSVNGNFCAGLETAGLNSLKNSETYKKPDKSFVGFDDKVSAECGSVTATALKESKGSITTNKGACLLGNSSFKLAVINEFGGNEVGYSVDNTNNSPKKAGAFCAKQSTNPEEHVASSACQANETFCVTVTNNCGDGFSNTKGHWVSSGGACL